LGFIYIYSIQLIFFSGVAMAHQQSLEKEGAHSLPNLVTPDNTHNPFVQIPLTDYKILKAKLENAKKGEDYARNFSSVIEDLKRDLNLYKDRASKYEKAFLEAELRCGQVIRSSLAKQAQQTVATESIVPSLSTEISSIGTEKVLANLVSENNNLRANLKKVLREQGLEYEPFKVSLLFILCHLIQGCRYM
jgi:hypothetical protein